MRGLFRFISLAFRRPKLALFLSALTLLLVAAVMLVFGAQFIVGDLNKVDLNFPTYDLGSIKTYTRVSGYTTNAWGHFSIRGSDGYLSYYLIPQFDNDTDPKSIKKMLVMRVDSEDVKTWNALTNYTQKRFAHTISSPPAPVHKDGYAYEMSYELREQALQYVQTCGFSYSEAQGVLVPYVLSNDSSNKYTMISGGAACALAAIVLFGIWFAKGANFRD